MKLTVMCVYDQKAKAYLQPFFSQTLGVALRQFKFAANDQSHDFSRFAEDFTLFELGTFEQDTAKFDLLEVPLSHHSALTYIDGDDQVVPIRKEA